MGHEIAPLPEYASAPIEVWWDMNGCPIPDGYDATRVRPTMEAEFRRIGYSGIVSITAYGDHTETPNSILRGLSSTGISVAHTTLETTCAVMYSDILKWRGNNPPPATMMLISDHVEKVFSWDVSRLQQETTYNLFVCSTYESKFFSVLYTRAEWVWKELLAKEINCSEFLSLTAAAMFYCKSCNFQEQRLQKFRVHLSTPDHKAKEAVHPIYSLLNNVTKTWGKNYKAKPEYATAQIKVWWDMNDCPIPEGYDATWVRPSIEEEFKKLGYFGPVSITAFGDHKKPPEHILIGLSSTSVSLAHTIPNLHYKAMISDVTNWTDFEPPLGTVMIISDHIEQHFSCFLSYWQQEEKHNFFLAYSFRPYKMSALVTSAEWLWDSLLSVSETRSCLDETNLGVDMCSGKAETTGMFYCKCCVDSSDYRSLESLRKHLSSEEHATREAYVYCRSERRISEARRDWLLVYLPKRRRLGKGFPTCSHLRLNLFRVNTRRIQRRAQMRKKVW